MASQNKVCACGTGNAYLECCGRFISGKKIPSSPEELMRSRYTAYTEANIDYIKNTMKSPAADDFDAQAATQWAKQSNWLKLEVINSTLKNPAHGFVEFLVHYHLGNKKHCLHEISEFKFEDNKWYYIDGVHPDKNVEAVSKVGRNEMCPCGSDKKYKKCCG